MGPLRSRSGRWLRYLPFHTGNLLVVQARDIQQPVELDGEELEKVR